jgi:hypothetical protein
MPRDWRPLVDQMTDVQKLVHLAHRQDSVDVEQRRIELLQAARHAYENELTIQAARVGCPGRVGRLANGPLLSELNDACAAWAESIANTYNYDLAVAIQNIAAETPMANRNTYAKRLRDWHEQRSGWKNPQIAQYTDGAARAQAQADFYRFNPNLGTATLEPTEAVCPVCQGWIERGEVSLRVALNHPPPYHPGCPHGWRTEPDRVPRDECPLLWMGE